MKRRKGFMEWDLFSKIVKDAFENGHNIASLHFFGEPLMWPHIVKGVALLSANNLFPRISTNGMLLTASLARQLQEAGLKEIMVTIDTLDEEAYGKIRKGGSLAIVKKNIHDVLDATSGLRVYAQFMPTKYNMHETEKVFYKEFGNRRNFKVLKWFIIRMNNSSNISRNLSHQANEVDKRMCDKIFDRLDVLWDGTTVLCCLDYEGKLVTGNLKENSISQSWLGPRAMSLRKKILRGEWSDLEACRYCVADHIMMNNKHWRITDPLSALPSKYMRLLKEIENLEEKNGHV